MRTSDALLGQATLAPQGRILQRPLDRRHQALRISLQYVVDGAASQRLDRPLLADRSGEEDEGNIGCHLTGDGERGDSIELGQTEIRENDVGQLCCQRGAHIGGRDDASRSADIASLLQSPDRELGIRSRVLDHENAQRVCALQIRHRTFTVRRSFLHLIP